jgi:hypothetical protein
MTKRLFALATLLLANIGFLAQAPSASATMVPVFDFGMKQKPHKIRKHVERATRSYIRPTPTPSPTYVATYGHNWDAVARCESGGNWAINTGNGFYGGLQFMLSTWQSMGGYGYPNQASRETQISIAEKVLAAVHGDWHSQWPICGAYL